MIYQFKVLDSCDPFEVVEPYAVFRFISYVPETFLYSVDEAIEFGMPGISQ